jgi:hypothetical protein
MLARPGGPQGKSAPNWLRADSSILRSPIVLNVIETVGTKANASANLIFAKPPLRQIDDLSRKEPGS